MNAFSVRFLTASGRSIAQVAHARLSAVVSEPGTADALHSFSRAPPDRGVGQHPVGHVVEVLLDVQDAGHGDHVVAVDEQVSDAPARGCAAGDGEEITGDEWQDVTELSDLPVVLLSVRVGIHDQIDGWRAGADDYLTKPFSPAALAAKVYEICGIEPVCRAEQRAERLEERVTLPGA